MSRKFSGERLFDLAAAITVLALIGSGLCYLQARTESGNQTEGRKACDTIYTWKSESIRSMTERLVEKAKAAGEGPLEGLNLQFKATSANFDGYLSCERGVEEAHPSEKYETYALILFCCGFGIPTALIAVMLLPIHRKSTFTLEPFHRYHINSGIKQKGLSVTTGGKSR